MTTFWLVAALLTVAVLAITFIPFLRYRGSGRGRMDYDVSVYADQLKEVDRDVERGLLNDAEAESARLEIKRRMLAAASADEAEDTHKDSAAKPLNMALAGSLAGVAVLGSLVVYNIVGKPGMPDQPHAERQAAAMGVDVTEADRIIGMVESLAAKLKDNPDDVEGWKLLGKSYLQIKNAEKAAAAYRQALQRGANDIESLFNFAIALSRANNDMIVPQARQALMLAYAKDPQDPDVLSYLALAAVQDGDAEKGIGYWKHLLEISPPDAPWRNNIENVIKAVAADFKLDPATIDAAKPQPGPMMAGGGSGKPPMAGGAGPMAGAGSGAGGGQFTPEQMQMIEGMVARLEGKLEENPDDFDGWMRLANSYKVLGRYDDSANAYDKAAAASPNDPTPLMEMTQLLTSTSRANGGEPFPARAVAAMQKVLAIDAKSPDALYYLGLAAQSAGDIAKARDFWTRLRDGFPKDSADYSQAQKFLDSLDQPAAQ